MRCKIVDSKRIADLKVACNRIEKALAGMMLTSLLKQNSGDAISHFAGGGRPRG